MLPTTRDPWEKRTMNTDATRCLVFDLGAGSGRAMLVEFTGDSLAVRELHRFSGYEVRLDDGPAWDVEAIRAGLREGLRRAADGPAIRSLAVDSWGVDFALVDQSGRLVDQPRTYRHPRGQRGMDALEAHHARIATRTGVQILPIITPFHLQDWAKHHPTLLDATERFLMTSDFYAFDLSGIAACENTLARTSGLVNVHSGDWDAEVLHLAGLPGRMFPHIVPSGTPLGRLKPELATGPALENTEVIAAAGHDTACAAFALAPRAGEAFAVCGSWILVGVEVPEGHLPEAAIGLGLGLEGGIGGRAILTRSLPGLFLMRRLRDSWKARSGEDVDFATLGRQAREADPATPAIDVTHGLFFDPQDMVGAMQEFNPILKDRAIGDLARALYLGLARAVTNSVAELSQFSEKPIEAIRVGGGGGQDAAWRHFLEAASGCHVQAGLVEASVVGNALVQLVGLKALLSFEAAQALARRATDSGAWRA